METQQKWHTIMQLMNTASRLYFVGIGGISVSGLAQLANDMGFVCAGSDASDNARTEALRHSGITCYSNHVAKNLLNFAPDIVIYSRAVADTNVELVAALNTEVPCLTRDEFLGWLNRHHQITINVAGTNGKTTTTAMIATVLLEAKLDPTIHLGAELELINGTVRLGAKNIMVSEACEFKRSFHNFQSQIATVLNLAHDHVDCYPTMADVCKAFVDFLNEVTPNGEIIVPAFDPKIKILLEDFQRANPAHFATLKIISFGESNDRLLGVAPTVAFSDLVYVAGLPSFNVSSCGHDLGRFSLSIPGRFNVDNALAAIACTVSSKLAVSAEVVRNALATFKGAEGRFTDTGNFNGARIIADYAHHPSSIITTLDACEKMPHNRIIAAFQPITHSRAEGLFNEFVHALNRPYPVDIVEIYDNREQGSTFSAKSIADAINQTGGSARFHKTPVALEVFLRDHLTTGDLAVLMGQDVRQVANNLTNRKI